MLESDSIKRLIHRILRRESTSVSCPPRDSESVFDDLPEDQPASYEKRLESEREFYNECINVHDLPEIFHIWSSKHLLPKLQAFSLTDPEQFYFYYSDRQCKISPDSMVRLLSIGSGNCDVEVRLAQNLQQVGNVEFRIQCLDINSKMLERGRQHAIESGVGNHLEFFQADFNLWRTEDKFDVVIANQALHHVLELEHLFSSVHQCLNSNGVFLTSDTIGRNGHLRWPEAVEAIKPFWDEMPDTYRFNQQLKRHEEQPLDHDCSTDGFEGIRAQDILPLLLESFHFELFIPFASIVLSFIDRPFGHNFDASQEWDRDFIDRVTQRDETGMLSGELKPTQMLAALRKEAVECQLIHPRLTPEFCIRWPDN